jgi:hypothetical protein
MFSQPGGLWPRRKFKYGKELCLLADGSAKRRHDLLQMLRVDLPVAPLPAAIPGWASQCSMVR